MVSCPLKMMSYADAWTALGRFKLSGGASRRRNKEEEVIPSDSKSGYDVGLAKNSPMSALLMYSLDTEGTDSTPRFVDDKDINLFGVYGPAQSLEKCEDFGLWLFASLAGLPGADALCKLMDRTCLRHARLPTKSKEADEDTVAIMTQMMSTENLRITQTRGRGQPLF
mmetsp:Transcript_36956/g.88398  ORF Transcript_36956/g.88398 Transcript_36956/m.88398 type:complete len:168 (-) Transcript_36956:260-763(-)